MKICSCQSNTCQGNTNRYKIHSSKNDTTYPNRFWGIIDYCNLHKLDDQKQGFILTTANEEKSTYIL